MTRKNINNFSELQNVTAIEQALNPVFGTNAADDILASYPHSPFGSMVELQNIKDDVAAKEIGLDGDAQFDEDYQDKLDDFWSDGVMQLWFIPSESNLYQHLLDWYGRQEYGAEFAIDAEEQHIRGFVKTYDGIFFTTGLGYDVISADLLGGTANGTAKTQFINFVEEPTPTAVDTANNYRVNELF